MISIIVIAVLFAATVASTTFFLRARKETARAVASVTAQPAIEVPTRPSRDLATLNQRWVNEQEHILYPRQSHNHKNCRACGPGPLGRNEVPSIYNHVYYGAKIHVAKGPYGGYWEKPVVHSPQYADVVSSEVEGTKLHTLMLDIDMPARLIESSTPGCYHLYIDCPMTWPKLLSILNPLADAGVIERGFLKMAKKHKATHLRPPWMTKAENEYVD